MMLTATTSAAPGLDSHILMWQALGGFVIVILGNVLTHYFWHRQKKAEHKHHEHAYKQDKKVEALMAAWGLLVYLTRTENIYSILVWVKPKNSEKVTWYFNPANAKAFMTELTEVFYRKGLGLFLEKETKNLFFECRTNMYGVLLKEKDNPAERYELKSEQLADKILEIYDRLNELLKEKI